MGRDRKRNFPGGRKNYRSSSAPLSLLSALGKTKPFALHSPPPSSSFLLLLLGFQPLSRAGKSVIMALRNSNDLLLLRTQRMHASAYLF